MIGVIGRKLGMTQIFNEAGQQVPCTVVEATPNPVVQVMEKQAHGFAAVQLGYGVQKLRRENKKGERTPPLIARNYKGARHANEIVVNGPCRIVYSPDKPLECGARVWIETEAEVVVEDAA